MMINAPGYFSLSDKDKIDELETGAATLERVPRLLEKDIWVVWALTTLFESEHGESLVFKGGTSLSKVYKVIDRFSEDVDVTYDVRKIIPDLVNDPEYPYPPNRSQAKKWTIAVRERLPVWLEDNVVPLIMNQIEKQGLQASLRLEDDNIHLDYNSVQSGTDTGYVHPTVLLEFGARSTGEPAERHPVMCDLAAVSNRIVFPQVSLRAMSAERTFWEKALAIHTRCRRGKSRGRDGYARHWYDLDCLDQAGIARDALLNRPLAKDVARHQKHFFRETDSVGEVIDYHAAVDGSLGLIPTGDFLTALKEDYGKMIKAGLFHSDVIPFDDLMSRLSGLQDRANAKES